MASLQNLTQLPKASTLDQEIMNIVQGKVAARVLMFEAINMRTIFPSQANIKTEEEKCLAM
jgi:hypothetical protein